MAKRLLRELAAQEADKSPALASIGPTGDDIFHWQAVMLGPDGTPYNGGKWRIDVDIPQNYPLAPPKMTFVTPICHPNIHMETGEVCIDVLKTQWTPAWTIGSALLAVQAMLSTPEPDSPLNIDAANLVRSGEKKGYEQLIEFYKHQYAMTS